MRLKVSKRMAEYIKKAMNEAGVRVDSVEVHNCSAEYCYIYTGYDWFDAEMYGDTYMDDEGRMRVKFIEVFYPYEYYANSRVITTKELCAEYKRCGANGEESLKKALREMIEI